MDFKRIIFDFDGTLMDTSEGVLSTMSQALTIHGVPHTRSDLSTFIGPPLHAELLRVFSLSSQKADEIVATYRTLYRDEGMYKNSHYPGVRALLKRLKLAGYQLYVATNKPGVFAEKIIEANGLAPYFDFVSGAGFQDLTDRKVDRINECLAHGDGPAIMVGDREGDVFGAQAAGIPSIYVGYGFGNREEAIACGATHFLPTVADVAQFFGVGGLFITFEGSDGAGKSTQIGLCKNFLQENGIAPVVTYEPGGCAISEKIRALLLDPENKEMTPMCEALLYAAARAQHVQQVIAPTLAKGGVVLCDRYYDSSLAYQGAGRGIAQETLAAINAPAMAGTCPTRTYMLLADPEKTLSRKQEAPDRLEQESADFKTRVQNGFYTLAQREKERVLVLDATCSIESIFAIIKEDLASLLL